MKPRVPVLVLFLFLSAAFNLHADSRPVRGSVLVLMKSAGSEEDPEFRSLLLDVCRVEIESRELEMIEPEASPPGDEQPIETARKAAAEFALTAFYATGDRDATFVLTWYDVAARTKAASVERKASLDFTLDITIASAIAELLEGQADRISALPLKPDPNAGAAIVTPSGETVSPPIDQVQLGGDIVRLRPLKRLAFTIGAAPLISTFGASDLITDVYFSIKTTAAWRFSMLGGAGGLGIASGLQRYYVTNILQEGWFTTIPIGAQVQYGTRMPGPFDFIFHLDGGMVLWFLDPDVGFPSNGMVPYVEGGVGFIVNVLQNLGVALDVNYAYYFFRNPDFSFLEPALLLVLKF
jgi:hypothetical protein